MSDYPQRLWMKAAAFAARCHRHQVRKDGQTPYVSHPYRVAMIVRDVFGFNDPEILSAALLHDTVEDCNIDYDEVAGPFGTRVADMVAALTKDMRLPDHLREPAYDEALAKSSWEARLIKLADVYDNIADAATDKAREKAAKKVARALALVENDEQLGGAAKKLREHCARVQKEKGTTS